MSGLPEACTETGIEISGKAIPFANAVFSRCGQLSHGMVQSHSIQINTGKIPFHHSGAAGSIFRIAIQIVRGKGKQIFQRFGLVALLNRKRIRIRIPLFYGSNDSRRHFFHPDGNLKLLQYSFTKGIPLRQFNPACCGIFARSGLVNGRKIPCDRKCFLPDFFTAVTVAQTV